MAPHEFQERQSELEEEGSLISDQFEVEFYIGNHYKHLKDARTNKAGKL